MIPRTYRYRMIENSRDDSSPYIPAGSGHTSVRAVLRRDRPTRWQTACGCLPNILEGALAMGSICAMVFALALVLP